MGGDREIEMRKPDQTEKGHVGLLSKLITGWIEQVRAYEAAT
ncbi:MULTISPECIES: hypothetical protein [Paenibacillus]|jgi:hypothetical protein|uniref:Uncharacterized protein n=1 Tax=Paenibacillus peoriae TaxID=59893 RepID=A0ABU1QBZ7_9BACL|nr:MULTISPECIES: hypothetical protein [Paenibacillus]MDR6777157.1 hypothetical protein [Paenibacillus peoriae]